MKLPSAQAIVQKQKTMLFFLAVFFAVGTISHLIPFLRPAMTILTPLVLLGAGVWTVAVWAAQQPEKWKPLLAWVGVTYLVTLTLEIVGVKTGLVFGAYTYGFGLGPRLLDVPLVIGFNWTLVVMGAHGLVSLFSRGWWRIPLTGAAAVVFDYVMEPVAMDSRMDYWTWTGGPVPLQNYIAWFVIAALAAWGLEVLRLKPGGLFAKGYVVIQFIFFLVLFTAFLGLGIA